MSYRKSILLTGLNGGFRRLPVSRSSLAEAVLHRKAHAHFRGVQHARDGKEIRVDFERTKEAYKSKDTAELLRGLLVFKLCSYDILVDKNKEVQRVLLHSVFMSLRFHVSSSETHGWKEHESCD